MSIVCARAVEQISWKVSIPRLIKHLISYDTLKFGMMAHRCVSVVSWLAWKFFFSLGSDLGQR